MYTIFVRIVILKYVKFYSGANRAIVSFSGVPHIRVQIIGDCISLKALAIAGKPGIYIDLRRGCLVSPC